MGWAPAANDANRPIMILVCEIQSSLYEAKRMVIHTAPILGLARLLSQCNDAHFSRLRRSILGSVIILYCCTYNIVCV